jgi:hypothetical protein
MRAKRSRGSVRFHGRVLVKGGFGARNGLAATEFRPARSSLTADRPRAPFIRVVGLPTHLRVFARIRTDRFSRPKRGGSQLRGDVQACSGKIDVAAGRSE